ncbi:PfkB family carbohydrate kinase [Planotetraspora sp. GP83]|uniref:PfkB family carbohydrate kinase n=1 Tax=Planotetraspora sp. GP83 TaxID=3156264 RepID=UPI003516F2EF
MTTTATFPSFPISRLVRVGSAIVDILLYVDHLPTRGGDVISSSYLHATGAGFNVLVGARRLGLPAAYGGLIGDGPHGVKIAADMDEVGIHRLLPVRCGQDSGFCVGFIEPDGERTFATMPGVDATIGTNDLAMLPIAAGDAVCVSGYDLCYPVSGESIASWVGTLPPTTFLVFDPGPLVSSIPRDRLSRILNRVDILSANMAEAAALTGLDEPAAAAVALAARGVAVIVRAGASGAWIASGTEVAHAPARRTTVVDTTGAGDSHLATLVARLAVGDDLYRAAHWANVAASLNVERRGPSAKPTMNEIVDAATRTPEFTWLVAGRGDQPLS